MYDFCSRLIHSCGGDCNDSHAHHSSLLVYCGSALHVVFALRVCPTNTIMNMHHTSEDAFGSSLLLYYAAWQPVWLDADSEICAETQDVRTCVNYSHIKTHSCSGIKLHRFQQQTAAQECGVNLHPHKVILLAANMCVHTCPHDTFASAPTRAVMFGAEHAGHTLDRNIVLHLAFIFSLNNAVGMHAVPDNLVHAVRPAFAHLICFLDQSCKYLHRYQTTGCKWKLSSPVDQVII